MSLKGCEYTDYFLEFKYKMYYISWQTEKFQLTYINIASFYVFFN